MITATLLVVKANSILHITKSNFVIVFVTFIRIIIISFHSGLKTFLFCKSFPLQPFLFFFRTDHMIPQTFTVTSEHIR